MAQLTEGYCFATIKQKQNRYVPQRIPKVYTKRIIKTLNALLPTLNQSPSWKYMIDSLELREDTR